MSSRMFCLLFFALLVAPGICNLELAVKYSSDNKCALKGSTISLLGTYKNHHNHTVAETYWTVNKTKSTEDIRVLNNPDYKERVQESLGKGKVLSLKITNVRHEDEGKYCLRIVTPLEILNLDPCHGIELQVTELSVEIPKQVIEGDSTVLTCKSTCILTGFTNFTWYKDGEPFSDWTGKNQLFLQSVSSEDAGKYSCTVRDQKHLSSSALTLNVRYPPKSVSVSISGSGDSVTLKCSSDSNPPALNFSWFKEDQSSAVGSGQSFSALQSGRYYCKANNPHGSRRSASVSVPDKESVSSWILITAGITAAAFVMLVILMVFIWIRRKRVTPPEEQNHRGSPQHKAVKSPENTYMTLDPKSRSSEYDTLDNMKRSSENMPSPGDQDPVYYNTSYNNR